RNFLIVLATFRQRVIGFLRCKVSTTAPCLPPTSHARNRADARRIRLVGFALIAAITACSTTSPIQQSRELWSDGRIDEAVSLLQEASKNHPDDRKLLAVYHRQRDLAVSELTIAGDGALAARHLDEAQSLYERALHLDPNAQPATDGLARIGLVHRLDSDFSEAQRLSEQGNAVQAEAKLRQILAVDPTYHRARQLLTQLREREQMALESSTALQSALATPVSIEFRETPLRNVFEVLSRAAGLNFVFDKDVKTDSKITIFIRNNPIEDVLRVLLSTNGLERKVLNSNTLLIYANTPAKLKEYQDLVARTFYLANADAKQVEAMLKTLTHIKDIFIDEKINTVIVRDTPAAVRFAEHMIESIDVAEPEVMLELQVIEISRTRAMDLGIQLPTSIVRSSSSPITTPGTAGASSPSGSIATSNFGSLITTIPNPLLIANLAMQDTDTNLLANPRIRVKNRDKAKVLIGEKLPVITSTAVQNAGVASSVSYIDVGIKLEVEPQVYLDEEVGIKVQLEVNSNLGEVTVGNSTTGITTAYQIGTRSAQTNLRLHDGETQVLSGLINDNETDSWNKVPGLSDIPGLGRLFSNNNSSHEKTEIIMLITPRIVRNLATPVGESLLVPAGTDAAVGAAPLLIGPLPPRSLSLRGTDANAPNHVTEPNVPIVQIPGRRSDGNALVPSVLPETVPSEPSNTSPATASSPPAPGPAAPPATAPTPAVPAKTVPGTPAPGDSFPPPPTATTPQAPTLTIDRGGSEAAPNTAPAPTPPSNPSDAGSSPATQPPER
ncbi:MAG TPA: secretin N-terminal domain-containing protein, partial [Burkholderiaceae bacterium]|nr:secretin N-terminal domain-containing protein [Burkholderiaceae bacterium]